MFSNNNFTIRNLTRHALPTSLYNTSGETSSPGRVCLSKGTSSSARVAKRMVVTWSSIIVQQAGSGEWWTGGVSQDLTCYLCPITTLVLVQLRSLWGWLMPQPQPMMRYNPCPLLALELWSMSTIRQFHNYDCILLFRPPPYHPHYCLWFYSVLDCPAIIQLEVCSRSISHNLDSADPTGHGNTRDWWLAADRLYRRQIAMAGCYIHKGWMVAPWTTDQSMFLICFTVMFAVQVCTRTLMTEPGWWCGGARWPVQSETWLERRGWGRLWAGRCCVAWYGNTTQSSPPSNPRPDCRSSDCERTASKCWTEETSTHIQTCARDLNNNGTFVGRRSAVASQALVENIWSIEQWVLSLYLNRESDTVDNWRDKEFQQVGTAQLIDRLPKSVIWRPHQETMFR